MMSFIRYSGTRVRGSPGTRVPRVPKSSSSAVSLRPARRFEHSDSIGEALKRFQVSRRYSSVPMLRYWNPPTSLYSEARTILVRISRCRSGTVFEIIDFWGGLGGRTGTGTGRVEKKHNKACYSTNRRENAFHLIVW